MKSISLSPRIQSWLCFLVGAAFSPFVNVQTVLPLAAWLAPVFLLRFARTQRARVAIPALGLVQYLAAVIALRNVFPWPMPFLFGLGAVAGTITFGADLFSARRLTGFARTLVFPAASVAVDWLFSQSSLGTFGSSAYAQFGDGPLTQMVSLTGIWGLMFLVNWLAPVVNEVWEQGSKGIRYSLAPFAMTLFAILLYGNVRIAFFEPVVHKEPMTVRVASLAADRALWHGLDIPRWSELAAAADHVRAFARTQFTPIADDLFARTAQQAQSGARIVVWSEASAFVLKEDEPELMSRAQALAQEEDIYLQISLVVGLRTDQFPFAENRTVMIDPAGKIVWDYAKAIHPLNDAQIFASGPGVVPVVDTPYGRLATVICFDADFPALIRQAGQARADILLVPSNDWQPIHTMHARAATFRAIENGVALVRATGNGLAIAVDALGQELAVADYYATDKLTMIADVPVHGGMTTLYTLIGDGFAYLSMVGLVMLIGLAFVRQPLSPQSEGA